MAESRVDRYTVTVKLYETPILFSKKYEYSLPDSAYGEWIIFESEKPTYYLNIFDELYKPIFDQLNSNVEVYLRASFEKKGLKLSLNSNQFGIRLPSKSTMIELTLEKIPLSYLS